MEKEILNILRLARILLSDEKYISEEQADKEWEEYQKLHPNRRWIHTRQDYLEMKGKEIEKKKESQGKDIGNVSDDVKDKLEIIPYFYSHPLYGGKKKQSVKDSGLDFTLPDRSSDRYLVKLNVDKFDNRWLESDTRNDFFSWTRYYIQDTRYCI